MSFSNDAIGGTTLVRPAIRSGNYVPGVSGWSINRDGTAEFASGTFRGPVIVQDPLTGAFLASIGAQGNFTGQLGQFTDVLVGNPGTSVLDVITKAPRGNIASGFIGGGQTLAGGAANAFTSQWWIPFFNDGTRFYHIYSSPMTMTNPAGTPKRFGAQYRATTPSGTGFSGVNGYVEHTLAAGAEVEFHLDYYFSSTQAGSQNITFELNGIDGTAITCQTGSGMGLFVDDIGVGGLPFNQGGTGSPPNVGTVTKKYYCTASQSYDGSGNPDPTHGGTTDLWFGRWDDIFKRSSQWSFPGATIRSDLTGASNISGKMWLYCFQAHGTIGAINFTPLANTSPAATYQPTAGTGAFKISNFYPVPAYTPMDLATLNDAGTQTILQSITAGANTFGLVTSLFANDGTKFSGFGAGLAVRPYLEITFTK